MAGSSFNVPKVEAGVWDRIGSEDSDGFNGDYGSGVVDSNYFAGSGLCRSGSGEVDSVFGDCTGVGGSVEICDLLIAFAAGSSWFGCCFCFRSGRGPHLLFD